ncbi:MAG: MFS transporter [Actinobacteria bacterium]|nr:MFS transporter [Actinomycetota bacterium]
MSASVGDGAPVASRTTLTAGRRQAALPRPRPMADRAFRCILIAAIQSLVGDQIARVALTVLVFTSTGSAAATAGAYALTLLPGLAGGMLGHLADRWPRGTLMVGCDLLRGGLLLLAGLFASSPAIVCFVLALVVMAGGPFQSAGASVVADRLSGEAFRSANTLRQICIQSAQVIGFGVGGVVVSAVGARSGLLIDALSFFVSAAIVHFGIGRQPRDDSAHDSKRSFRAGLRAVLADQGQRVRLGVFCLLGFWIVPEGLAGPYAASVGGGSVRIGVLLTAVPAGFAVGSLVFKQLSSARISRRAVAPLAVFAGLPMIALVGTPPLPVAVVLLMLSGIGTSAFAIALTEYIETAPSANRGQAVGVSQSVGLLVQGVGVIVGGALAEGIGPGRTLALAGLAASVVALPVARARIRWLRRESPQMPATVVV